MAQNRTQNSNNSLSLLDSVTPQIRQKILQLIKRLGDEKVLKEEWQKKYNAKVHSLQQTYIQVEECRELSQQNQSMRAQIEKLSKQNKKMNSKWNNSCSMISKVREKFSSQSKTQKYELGEAEKSDIKKIMKSYQHRTKDSEKQNQKDIGTNSENDQEENSFDKSNSVQVQVESLVRHQVSGKKIGFNKSEKKNENHSSSKKLEILHLKQQIEQLTEEISTKQNKNNLTLEEKARKCEEIKNRYRQSPKQEASKGRSPAAKNSNSTKANLIYYDSNHVDTSRQHHPRNININEKGCQSLRHADASICYPPKNNKSVHLTKLNLDGAEVEGNSFYMNKSSSKILVFDDHYHGQSPRCSALKTTIVDSNKMHTSSTHQNKSNISNNSNYGNPLNTSKMSSAVNIRESTSFYDEGLLDLIEEMNK